MIPNEVINVVCASDEAFAMHMTVMLKSLLSHTSTDVAIYVLDGNIQNSTKLRVEQSLSGHSYKIFWIQIDHSSLSHLKVSGHIPIQTYYRLLMQYVLPESVQKVIYLDCDMVVMHDIAELWRVDIGNLPLLAVPALSMKVGFPHYKECGFDANWSYFNAGLIVINLDYWRVHNIGQLTIDYIATNEKIIQYHDQDGLNCVFANQWGEIDLRWNVLTPSCVLPNNPIYYKKSKFYDANRLNIPLKNNEVLEDVINNPYIIHYAAGEKPWHYGCDLPYTQNYYDFLDQTSWALWRPTWWGKQVLDYKQLKKIHGFPKCILYVFVRRFLSVKYFIGSNLRRFGLID